MSTQIKNKIEDIIERRGRQISSSKEFARWVTEIMYHSDDPRFELKERSFTDITIDTDIGVFENGRLHRNGKSLDLNDPNDIIDSIYFIAKRSSKSMDPFDDATMAMLKQLSETILIKVFAEEEYTNVISFVHHANEFFRGSGWNSAKKANLISAMKELTPDDLATDIQGMSLYNMIIERFSKSRENSLLLQNKIMVTGVSDISKVYESKTRIEGEYVVKANQTSASEMTAVPLNEGWTALDIKENGIDVKEYYDAVICKKGEDFQLEDRRNIELKNEMQEQMSAPGNI